MKNLIAIVLLSVTISGFAQTRKNTNRGEGLALTAEQRTELQVKKLTLELDLTPEQQREITKIVAKQQSQRDSVRKEMVQRRAENKKMIVEKRQKAFATQSKVLDEKIATRNALKKVLTAEQLEKFDNMPKTNDKRAKNEMKRKARSEK
jgi:hypothetical protein